MAQHGAAGAAGAAGAGRKQYDRVGAAARFRATFEQAAVGLAHVGLDGRWLEVNPRLCAILGYPRDALLLQRFQDLTHPDDLAVGLTYADQLLRGEIATYSVEKRYIRPDGSSVWVALTVALARTATGEPQYFIACIEDVAARKEAQQRLAEASAFLADGLDYEATLSRLVAAVAPHMADWCCVVVRAPTGALSRVRVAHTDPAKLALLHELERLYPLDPAAPEGEPQVLRTGQPVLHTHISAVDVQATARDPQHAALLQQLGMVSALFVPLMARGRTLGVLTLVAAASGRRYGPADLVAAQDLASRAALAVDNAQLYRQAREAVRVRDDFLLAASHDLRTPLTSIRGYTQVMEMRLESGKALSIAWLRRQVRTMNEAATRMAAALEAITDVAQLQIGQALIFQVEAIKVEALVRAAARHVAGADGRRVTPVRVTTRAPGPVVMGDRVRLERVLYNIVGNAITYSPPGATVQVEVDREDSWAVIAVRDQGVGVPSAELPHIVTRFYRASTSKGVKGTGIGLAASRAIVEQHGGQITMASTLGRGTTVTIRLPLASGSP